MTTISRQLRLPYTSAQMYALVNDVASYPLFVPWCSASQVYEASATHMRAAINIEWQGVGQRFITDNQLVENQSITMHLVEGGIKNLQGIWRFNPVGEACVVQLTVTVTFNNRLVALVFSKVTDMILNRICDAFCARAKVLYG